jgi:acyl-CoA synthetase (NDP forming)
VAVVGASADTSKWGGDLAARLARDERRTVSFVNRRGGSLYGRPVYPSIGDLPEDPDLVVLAIPAAALDAVLDEALARGARAFVGIFAGLGETGAEGAAREAAVAARVRAAGAVLLGPNCMGLADHGTGFEAVAYVDVPVGAIGFASQSGAMGEEFVMRARAWGCGFSRYVTLGNQADLGAAELVTGFADHERTTAVALYVEDFRDGRAFVEAAATVVDAGKPVVLLAPGRSEAGIRAARSHTGSLAAGPAAVEAACRAAGMLRAETPRELFELVAALQSGARLRGRRVAVVSDGGGPGGIAADALTAADFDVPAHDAGLAAQLRAALPGSAGDNPLDFALGTIEPDAFGRAVPILAAHEEVDAVVAAGQLGYWAARFPQFEDLVAQEVAGAGVMAAAARETATPLVVATVYPDAAPARELRAAGVPVYRELASAVSALAALRAAGSARSHLAAALPAPSSAPFASTDYAGARDALAAAGVPMVDGRRCSADEAPAAAAAVGYPVVLKALGLLHKSDAGGVVLGIGGPAELADALVRLEATLAPPGYVVEHRAPIEEGFELLVGCRRDARFGPLLVLGAGGVYAEVLHDVHTVMAPAGPDQVLRLLHELRVWPLLAGARGRPPLDVQAAAEAAALLSRLAAAHPEVDEIEVNPLLVLPLGVLGLDARIVGGAGDGAQREGR